MMQFSTRGFINIDVAAGYHHFVRSESDDDVLAITISIAIIVVVFVKRRARHDR